MRCRAELQRRAHGRPRVRSVYADSRRRVRRQRRHHRLPTALIATPTSPPWCGAHESWGHRKISPTAHASPIWKGPGRSPSSSNSSSHPLNEGSSPFPPVVPDTSALGHLAPVVSFLSLIDSSSKHTIIALAQRSFLSVISPGRVFGTHRRSLSGLENKGKLL